MQPMTVAEREVLSQNNQAAAAQCQAVARLVKGYFGCANGWRIHPAGG